MGSLAHSGQGSWACASPAVGQGKIYPPMSDQLAGRRHRSPVFEGFDEAAPFRTRGRIVVVIGNAGLPRGHPAVEYVLEQRNRLYVQRARSFSGDYILKGQVGPGGGGYTWQDHDGQHAGVDPGPAPVWRPGYLIGGAPHEFFRTLRPPSASSPFFVVEADEYDTSRISTGAPSSSTIDPRTLILNNLEFDHADIYAGSRRDPDAVSSTCLRRRARQRSGRSRPRPTRPVNQVLDDVG